MNRTTVVAGELPIDYLIESGDAGEVAAAIRLLWMGASAQRRRSPSGVKDDPLVAPSKKSVKKHVQSVELQAGATPTGAISRKRWITEKKVEAEFGFAAKTLRNKRSLGEGPPFRKFKRAVLYQIAAVEEWIERQPQGGDGVPTSALKRS